jgi:hypothetical protein
MTEQQQLDQAAGHAEEKNPREHPPDRCHLGHHAVSE